MKLPNPLLIPLAFTPAVLAYPTAPQPAPADDAPVNVLAAEPADVPGEETPAFDPNLQLAEQCLLAAPSIQVGQNPVFLKQFTLPDEGTLTVELTYEGTGWLAFGFSETGSMVGSTAILGLPDDAAGLTNPGKYFLSERSTAGVQLVPDTEQTQMDASITQTDTDTVLRFTKPLIDTPDIPLTADGQHTFLFAYGFSNGFAQHVNRGSFPLTLTPCLISDDGPPSVDEQSPEGVSQQGASSASSFYGSNKSFLFVATVAVAVSFG